MSGINLKPISKSMTTQDKVYKQIKRAILNGQIASSDTFTEVQLAESLDTSRTPVRGALQDLIKEGLIVSTSRKGMSVRNITEEERDEIFLLRIQIETEIIRRLAASITDEQIKVIKEIYAEQLEAMKQDDGIRFIDLDQKFHIQFVRFCNYAIIESVLLNLHNLSQLISLKAISHQGRMHTVAIEHEKIIKALEQKNPEEAAKCMEEHLRQTNETINIVDKPSS